MNQLLARLREKAAAEVRYARGVRRIFRERLRVSEKELAAPQSAGSGFPVAWLIEDRAAMIGALRRVGRTLREARERLRALDNALGPRGSRLASIQESPVADAPSSLTGVRPGMGRCHHV
jgi:hypothetical protein